jgi:beta-glucosidase
MKKTIIITGIVILVLALLLAIDAFTFGKSFAYLKHLFFPPAIDPQWEQHEPAPYIKRFHAGISAEKKARVILKEMTLEEKIRYISGYEYFGTYPIERLNLPPVWFADATSGVRRGLSTAFPVNVAMTASWNRELIKNAGTAIAEECRAKGVSVLLGPGMNMYRVPTCGRNFEYMGEDPFLAGSMGSAYIHGVQSRDVIACAKHYTANNSDYDRHRMSSDMDERTLREIYLPHFRMSVKDGNVKSIMTAYNPVNGIHASQHEHLISDILFGEWGFDGFVMSDWLSVYSVAPVVKHGVDIEMPSGKYLNKENILPLIEKGEINEADIDRKVMHMLTTFFEMGILERPVVDDKYGVNTDEHRKAALDIAREGIVLLKNENSLLPLVSSKVKKIAVLGPMAKDTETSGGGSSEVFPFSKTDILTGLKELAPEGVEVEYAGSIGSFITGRSTVKNADAVIVCVGFNRDQESETFDKSWDLPGCQEDLIENAADLNPNTIVVLTTGSGVEGKWIDSVPGLVHSFFLGQSTGIAVADVLYGNVNPGGKLPFTMAMKWDDILATRYYVAIPWLKSPFRIFGNEEDPEDPDDHPIFHMEYGEKLMVGYRHFDTNNVEPRFPFGFGLSYTTFDMPTMSLSSRSMRGNGTITARVTVKNTGKLAGSEVVQLYVQDVKSSHPRPLKELKGFSKVHLQPGQSKTVSITIDRMALSYFNPDTKKWTAEPGEFVIMVGNSSRNILQKKSISLL